MSNWKSISSFVKFSVKGITPKYVDKSSIIVLNQKCIRNNKIDYFFSQFTDDTKEISELKFVQKGDILVNSTGTGTAGRCAFVSELPENHKLIVDSHILILRCGSYYEAQCLSYVLYSFEKTLMSFMTGSSGQSELDKVVLLGLKTKMSSSLITQQNIASVLSSLESKIELNNRINVELEAMAKTLYDYWFVQFDFPDKNGKPYKTSCGRMVWNEELKRRLPEGWEVKKLSEITEVSNESLNPMNYPNKEFKYYSLPGFDETGTFKLEKGEEIKSNKFIVGELDILVSKLNPRFNRVIYSTIQNDLICSTEFVVWRAKNYSIKNYLFMIARDYSFIRYCTKSASGTSNSHKRVNPNVMMDFQVVYNETIAEKFGEILGPIIKTFAKNHIENQQLTSLRDWLLPMLMNGQVRVGEPDYEYLSMVAEDGVEWEK